MEFFVVEGRRVLVVIVDIERHIEVWNEGETLRSIYLLAGPLQVGLVRLAGADGLDVFHL